MTIIIIQAWTHVTPILVYWMEHASESVTADFIASVRRASVDKSVTLVSYFTQLRMSIIIIIVLNNNANK